MDGKLLLGHAQQVLWCPGAAGRSCAGQVRQPIFGPGRPRECALPGGGAEVGIDLAGDVALQERMISFLDFPSAVRRSA